MWMLWKRWSSLNSYNLIVGHICTETKTCDGESPKAPNFPKIPNISKTLESLKTPRVISLHIATEYVSRDCFHWLCQKDKMVIYVLV